MTLKYKELTFGSMLVHTLFVDSNVKAGQH